MHLRNRRVPARGNWLERYGSVSRPGCRRRWPGGWRARPSYCLDGQGLCSRGGGRAGSGRPASWTVRPNSMRWAGSVPDGGGVVFVPALAGLGAPHWRPDARGAFLGLTLGASRAHLIRAAIDGLAASVALLARSVAHDLGGAADDRSASVDGGARPGPLVLLQAPGRPPAGAGGGVARVPDARPRTGRRRPGPPRARRCGIARRCGRSRRRAANYVLPRNESEDEATYRLAQFETALAIVTGNGRMTPPGGAAQASRPDRADRRRRSGLAPRSPWTSGAPTSTACVADAGNDVGTGTSTKANTAILHAGFDAGARQPAESTLVQAAALSQRRVGYAQRAGIPLSEPARCSMRLVGRPATPKPAWRRGQGAPQRLPWRPGTFPPASCTPASPIWDPGALGALEIPDESIICPWTTPLAFATEAVRAGVRLELRTRVRTWATAASTAFTRSAPTAGRPAAAGWSTPPWAGERSDRWHARRQRLHDSAPRRRRS